MVGKANRKHAKEGYISFCFCVSYFANMHALISMNKSWSCRSWSHEKLISWELITFHGSWLCSPKLHFTAYIQQSTNSLIWKVIATMPTLVTATTTATSNLDKANLLNSTFMKNFNFTNWWQPQYCSSYFPFWPAMHRGWSVWPAVYSWCKWTWRHICYNAQEDCHEHNPYYNRIV